MFIRRGSAWNFLEWEHSCLEFDTTWLIDHHVLSENLNIDQPLNEEKR